MTSWPMRGTNCMPKPLPLQGKTTRTQQDEGLVVLAGAVPGELQFDPAIFIGPDFFAGLAHHQRRLGVHARFCRDAGRSIGRGLGDRFEAVAIAVVAGFVADRGHDPIDIQRRVFVAGEGEPIPWHQPAAIAFADKTFLLAAQAVHPLLGQRIALGLGGVAAGMFVHRAWPGHGFGLAVERCRRRGELIVGCLVNPGHRLQAHLPGADAMQFPLADYLPEVVHRRPVGNRCESVVAVGQDQRVGAFLMGEEPEDPVFFQQARDEGQVGLAILHAVFARGVAAGELELEVGETMGLENRGDDVRCRKVLEHAVVAGQAQPPEPGPEQELIALGGGVGGELADFRDQQVQRAQQRVLVQGRGDVTGNGGGEG